MEILGCLKDNYSPVNILTCVMISMQKAPCFV